MTDDTLFPDTALLSKEEDQSCLRKEENVKLPFSVLLFSGNLKEFSCDNFQRQIPRTKKDIIFLYVVLGVIKLPSEVTIKSRSILNTKTKISL